MFASRKRSKGALPPAARLTPGVFFMLYKKGVYQMNRYICEAKTNNVHLNIHHNAKKQNFFYWTKDFRGYRCPQA